MVHFTIPPKSKFTPRIVVFGVGGGGGNAINNMIAAGLEGVEFVVANTDAQALEACAADRKIQLGEKLTGGLGAGSDPDLGASAADESMDEISDALDDANMVFIAAGMGGGTGTGAAPVIAKMARERNMLTVGIVTKPFNFDGMRKMQVAEAGIERLAQVVDTLIIIPNQNLFRRINADTSMLDAYAMVDEVLHAGVSSITDLITRHGLVNVDFNDVKGVIQGGGKAVMGTGEAEGENRAILAAEAAISNPLLDDVSMNGAKGLLVNFMGGNDLGLIEVDAAMARIQQEVAPDANIKHGVVIEEIHTGKVRISVVASGIDMGGDENAKIIEMPNHEATLAAESAMPLPDAAPNLSTSTQAAPSAQESLQPVAQNMPAINDLPGFLAGVPSSAQEAEIPHPIRERQLGFLARLRMGRKKKQATSDDAPPHAEARVDNAMARLPIENPQNVAGVSDVNHASDNAEATQSTHGTPSEADNDKSSDSDFGIPRIANICERQENFDTAPPEQTDVAVSALAPQFAIESTGQTSTGTPPEVTVSAETPMQSLLGETISTPPRDDTVSVVAPGTYDVDNTEIPAFLRR